MANTENITNLWIKSLRQKIYNVNYQDLYTVIEYDLNKKYSKKSPLFCSLQISSSDMARIDSITLSLFLAEQGSICVRSVCKVLFIVYVKCSNECLGFVPKNLEIRSIFEL